MTPETAREILEQVKIDYNNIAAEFSATRAHLWGEFIEFGKYVKQGDTVLDVGCGNGRLYELLKEKKISYFGVDVSEQLIALAFQKWGDVSYHVSAADSHDRENLLHEKPRFEVGDILAMQYREQFDVVFGIAMLHHIPSVELRRKAVVHLYQALKPGGTLVLTVWNLWQPKFWKLHVQQIFRGSTSKDLSPYGRCPGGTDFGDLLIPWKGNAAPRVQAYRYYHAFTLRELRRLLEETGFEIQDAHYGKQGKRVHWWQRNNLVIVAKKEHAN